MFNAIARTTMIDNTSRQVLDTVPGRALAFLRAASTTPAIRAVLEGAGYTDADHAEGWNLFFKVSGYAASAPAVVVTKNRAEQVVSELETWQRTALANGKDPYALMTKVAHDMVAFVISSPV